jgi:hypothetical protein
MKQRLPGAVSVPSAMHAFCTQHPPLLHMLFAQHAWPGPPHGMPHEPAAHIWLFEHVVPVVTQRRAPVSQHPPEPHVSPAQHGWPAPPHCAHTRAPPPPVHARPVLHVSPQHG